MKPSEEPGVTGGELDADTAVSPEGEGGYTATVTPRWNIGDRPKGKLKESCL